MVGAGGGGQGGQDSHGCRPPSPGRRGHEGGAHRANWRSVSKGPSSLGPRPLGDPGLVVVGGHPRLSRLWANLPPSCAQTSPPHPDLGRRAASLSRLQPGAPC